MTQSVIQLTSSSPISSVSLIDRPATAVNPPTPSPRTEADSRKIRQAVQALEEAAQQIQELGRQIVDSHREQLIRLSIEIAAKVLAKEIRERNYEIEKIISQALEEVPRGRPVTVRLNPEDLKTCQPAPDQEADRPMNHLRLAADASVGPGECIVETEQGVIEWIIEEHLNRIAAALLGTHPNS